MKHQKLIINTDLATQILTGFIKSELNRVGFTKAVLGLSGGIDSALSCYLAAKALGPENVLAIRMPYKNSSEDSLSDAQKVIDSTGVQSKTIEITDIVQPLINMIPAEEKVRKGNTMARARMMVLFDQSADFNGLVVGTSNKTEILLGYSTQWGDSACAINPIGDLYKAQVRQLSKDLGVPQSILDKAPSADLWSGQTDETELGFTYEDVDQLFYYLIDERYSPEKCIDLGFDENFVTKVIKRVRMTHYKRVMPPIAKLSNRTVGYDFLYLRDWGT
jgi:NAD+ synthase